MFQAFQWEKTNTKISCEIKARHAAHCGNNFVKQKGDLVICLCLHLRFPPRRRRAPESSAFERPKKIVQNFLVGSSLPYSGPLKRRSPRYPRAIDSNFVFNNLQSAAYEICMPATVDEINFYKTTRIVFGNCHIFTEICNE